MRDSSPDPAIHPWALGESYARGAFFYEHSKIARNQIDAINLKLHGSILGWNPTMEKAFAQLEVESKVLVKDKNAIAEYAKTKKDWKNKLREAEA
jgi:hypothetical protein